jgi:hypothetical protein
MAKEGLWVLVCAGALAGADPAPQLPARPADDRDDAVAATLAVQTALRQGREFLLQNNARAAVEVLERQLPRINGNPVYLAALRDAYRAYVKELRLAKREAEARKYAQLLAVIDPGSTADRPPAPAEPPSSVLAAPKPPAPSDKPAVVRLKREEDDFFKPAVGRGAEPRSLFDRAEEAFSNQKYPEAKRLYDQAFQADRSGPEPSREKWAYCRLYEVVECLNGPAPSYGSLEQEVRSALSLNLSPKIDEYARHLLAEIEKRKAPPAAEPPVPVRDAGQSGGWAVAETANFRVYYKQGVENARRAAQVAERTRSGMGRKWFGAAPADWNPKCAVYLHPTGQDYSRATGVPSGSPGHSSFDLRDGRVLDRRIDLHCDVPDMLSAVLPHEATHVVLAGNFGQRPVPRWADEGIAVLTEPREKIERHLVNLPRHAQERQLFSLRELVQMPDYPAPQRVGVFYAESVSLCEFLAKEKGPHILVAFIRDGMYGGFDAALQRHYGYVSFEELEQRWGAWAIRDRSAAGVAQGAR